MDNYLLIMGYILNISALIVKELKDMKYLAILFLFIGCQFEFENETIIDPELMIYYQSFINEAQLRNVELPQKSVMIYWSDHIENNSGHCDWTKKYCTIKINELCKQSPTWWTEAVVFHELGHGLLNRHHLPLDENAPLSLMRVPSQRKDYPEKRELYINELFGVNL